MTIRSVKEIWEALQDVKDPEIPVISVVELGIVRDIAVADRRAVVTITPTFAGCPALHAMKTDIKARLLQLGLEDVEVEISLSPPWTTDWISATGREKLKAFGLAPPPQHGGQFEVLFYEPAACPYCESQRTTLKNSFGSTLCRAIYYCNDCQQPFEQFKPL